MSTSTDYPPELYPRFRTKSGRLTRYALHCGYIEVWGNENRTMTMWYEGGMCVHIRTHDNEQGRLEWSTTALNMKEARKELARHKREYFKGQPCNKIGWK